MRARAKLLLGHPPWSNHFSHHSLGPQSQQEAQLRLPVYRKASETVAHSSSSGLFVHTGGIAPHTPFSLTPETSFSFHGASFFFSLRCSSIGSSVESGLHGYPPTAPVELQSPSPSPPQPQMNCRAVPSSGSNLQLTTGDSSFTSLAWSSWAGKARKTAQAALTLWPPS